MINTVAFRLLIPVLFALVLGSLLASGCKDKKRYYTYEEAIALTTDSHSSEMFYQMTGFKSSRLDKEETIIEILGATNGVFTYGLCMFINSGPNHNSGGSVTSWNKKKREANFKLSFLGREILSKNKTWQDDSSETKISWDALRSNPGEFYVYPFHNQDGDPLLVVKQRKKPKAEVAHD
jgi:hypothetical protein